MLRAEGADREEAHLVDSSCRYERCHEGFLTQESNLQRRFLSGKGQWEARPNQPMRLWAIQRYSRARSPGEMR